MEQVTVSPKFEVVIPKSVRDYLGIRTGQRMWVIPYRGRIEILPAEDVRGMTGFVAGMRSDFEREPDRDL